MKKHKSIIFILCFIVLSNFPPMNGIFGFFLGDPLKPVSYDHLYVSKDLKYKYYGDIKDTLQNDCYKQFRLLFPTSDPTLYRVQRIELWKFWRWGKYMTEERWRQPYRKVSDEKMKEADLFFFKTYRSPDGTYDCKRISLK